jgi:hypothetical protein
MEVKDIQERINSAVSAEELRQVEEMIANGYLSLNDRYSFIGGQVRNIGKTIKFDMGKIDMVRSIEIDNIARDVEYLFMREEISEVRYDALMDVIK